jgi:signal transduction histidine kinase
MAPLALTLLFVVMTLSARGQRNQALNELNKSLEASLLLEGHVRSLWLSERLDPFFSEWQGRSREPLLPDLTGASWLLLDASGEAALTPDADPLYADPASATGEITLESEDLPYFGSALGGSEVTTPAERARGRYRRRVYIPVSTASGAISTRWVLVGQVAQGSNEDSYFAQLDRAQRRYWLTATPLSIASLLFLILLLRGIARTNRLERAFRETEESIELESLTSTLAHELRNPLSIIQSCAEILSKGEDLTEDGKELVSDLISEVRRSQDVLSRHLHPERFAVSDIEDIRLFTEQFWQRRQALLQTHALHLEMNLPSSAEPLLVDGDPDRLERILDNLLRNSIEAMPKGGVVRFSLEDHGRSVVLRFEDNGPGLRGAAFFTRDGWRMGSVKPGGKGVGLRLARKWVSRWGGEFSARNLRKGLLRRVVGTAIAIRLLKNRKESF